MLIFILINVQYLQNVVFSSEKRLNGQNHYSSGSHHPNQKIPPAKFPTPSTGGDFSLPLNAIWKILL